jgi:N-acyl amino acid synthase of PEP-CTERM/exosortase system
LGVKHLANFRASQLAPPQYLDMADLCFADLFETHFGIVPANSGPLLDEVFRLRHQVYCEELGFEPQRANQLEHDEYDKRSIHCLLFHKASKTYVGCVRLVLSSSTDPYATFPFELACGESLRWVFDRSAGTARQRYGEISRLAIAARFRRRRNEKDVADGGSEGFDARPGDERRLFPSVALGLYLAITAMGLSQGLDGVFAMMEPRLARQLRRFGILFEQVGDAVEHRGTRVPYFISRDTIFNNLKPDCRALLGKIQDVLAMHHAQRS